MADREPDKSEKTEPATPFKLEEARKKGSVTKSLEVNSFAIVLMGLIFMVGVGTSFVTDILSLSASMLSQAGQVDYRITPLLNQTSYWTLWGASSLAPLVALSALVGVVATILQTGPVFSFTPLKPDVKRLNPVQGFKRLFSIKLGWEFVKSLVKLVIYGAIIFFTVTNFLPDLLSLYQVDHGEYLPRFVEFSATLIFFLLLAMLLVAILDMLFTRWEYRRNLRMTRKELKDEVKRREGDPHVRQKRKEIERELRKRSETLGGISEADLVVVNPTRFAVALKYDRATMISPVVWCKGAGDLAGLMREEAYRQNVPVLSAPRLARWLFRRCPVDSAIPQTQYVAVAKLFRQAYAIKRESKVGSQ